MLQVRRAILADAEAIATVHVASWRSTYAGILPQAYVEERTMEARQEFWTEVLIENDPAVCVFVACRKDGTICGFASGGPERTGLLGMPCELYSLYLLDSAQGFGLGRRLVKAVLTTLRVPSVAVWVLRDNSARGFYEHLGGVQLTETVVETAGVRYVEVAYAIPS